MSNDQQYDVIVVGAGLAGVCCAGELALRGARPLLICETAEVASTLRPVTVGSGHGFLQHPTSQHRWGGGWWFQLVRDLNVPGVRLHPSIPFAIKVKDSPLEMNLPMTPSAAGLTDFFCEAVPPIQAFRGEFEKVFTAAFALPYEEMFSLDRVPFAEWLGANGASDALVTLLNTLVWNLQGLPGELAHELSATGGLATLRGVLGGEISLMVTEPDPVAGLAIPICTEVERRGGAVWRGRKVANVLMDSGRATGVVLQDGTEVRAKHVAIAAGNPRIRAILDPLPAELEEPLTYSAKFTGNTDYTVYGLLDKPVVKHDQFRWLYWLNPDFTLIQLIAPLHQYPWTTQDGNELLVSWANYPSVQVEKLGGKDGIVAQMTETTELLAPGYKDALVDTVVQSHKHHWAMPLLAGPKIPRKSQSVEGLWFVGDGAGPVVGMWAEAPAGSGIVGARAIVKALSDAI